MKKKYLILLILILLISNVFSVLFTTDINNLSFDIIHLCDSETYTTIPREASNYVAGNRLSSDYPIFWQDISSGISEKNKALGYIDVMVSVIISNIPGDTTVNKWLMYGDTDYRDYHDMRAWCDGSLYDIIDPDAKCQNYYYETSIVSGGLSGQWTILRFAVPHDFTGSYKLFLGKYIIHVDQGRGIFYQVKLYTPVVSTEVIPVVKITYPDNDIRYEENYSYDNHSKLHPIKKRYIAVNTPVNFSAEDTLNYSGKDIVSYSWDFGDGTQTLSGETATHIYSKIGDYKVILTVKLSDGTIYKNNGTANITASYDPANLSPLPYEINVIDPPKKEELFQARPTPFVVSKDGFVLIDYNLATDTQVKLSVYNIKGDLVKVLKNEYEKSGYWTVKWDGKNDTGKYVGDSFYYYVLQTDNGKYIKKIRVIR